jgi:sugar (pentulose or hexulose) kinase
MDYSLASRAMLMDINSKTLASSLLLDLGIERSNFYPIKEASSLRGTLDPLVAERLGLNKNVIVVTGGFDQCCAAVGSGCIRPGLTALSMGTLEAIVPFLDNISVAPSLLRGNHGCTFHCLPGVYSTLGYVTSSGGALAWFDRKFMGESGVIYRDDYLNKVLEGPSELILYPYVTGAGTPWIDENRKGSIHGLTLDKGIDDIVRALIEGIAFEVKANVEDFESAGVSVKLLKASGGGSLSDTLLQLRADVTGLPVERVPVSESGCLGAAFIAGLGAGIFNNPYDIQHLVARGKIFEPRKELRGQYESAYRMYKEGRNRNN